MTGRQVKTTGSRHDSVGRQSARICVSHDNVTVCDVIVADCSSNCCCCCCCRAMMSRDVRIIHAPVMGGKMPFFRRVVDGIMKPGAILYNTAPASPRASLSVDIRMQTCTKPVAFKYRKPATKYPCIYGYFLQCILNTNRFFWTAKELHERSRNPPAVTTINLVIEATH